MTIDIGPNLVSVIIAIIGAISSIVAAYFASKASTSANKASVTTTSTHDLVNGRMGELIDATSAVARAQGVSAGLVGDTVVPTVSPTTIQG